MTQQIVLAPNAPCSSTVVYYAKLRALSGGQPCEGQEIPQSYFFVYLVLVQDPRSPIHALVLSPNLTTFTFPTNAPLVTDVSAAISVGTERVCPPPPCKCDCDDPEEVVIITCCDDSSSSSSSSSSDSDCKKKCDKKKKSCSSSDQCVVIFPGKGQEVEFGDCDPCDKKKKCEKKDDDGDDDAKGYYYNDGRQTCKCYHYCHKGKFYECGEDHSEKRDYCFYDGKKYCRSNVYYDGSDYTNRPDESSLSSTAMPRDPPVDIDHPGPYDLPDGAPFDMVPAPPRPDVEYESGETAANPDKVKKPKKDNVFGAFLDSMGL